MLGRYEMTGIKPLPGHLGANSKNEEKHIDELAKKTDE